MKIKPNASSSEISSPFYKINEEFCSEFESFIADKNGKVKGNYNASSYIIFGKISNPKKWDLMYKKSTFTSTGNLFISSKKQSLFTMAEWKTKRIGTHNSEFLIRKKSKVDFIKFMLNKSLSTFDNYNIYVIDSKNNKSQLISKLTKILEPLFKSGEIYTIDHRNDKLKIELRTEKHHFDMFNKLTEI